MNTATAFLDRTVTFIVALLLIAAGVWGVLVAADVQPVADWHDSVDFGVIGRWLDQPWYPWLLAGLIVAPILLAMWFIIPNASLRRPDPVIDEHSDEGGELSYGLADIGSAVAGHLTRTEGVRRASARAEDDRGDDLITLTVSAENSADVPAVVRACDAAAADVAAAVDGADVGVRFLVHLDSAPQR